MVILDHITTASVYSLFWTYNAASDRTVGWVMVRHNHGVTAVTLGIDGEWHRLANIASPSPSIDAMVLFNQVGILDPQIDRNGEALEILAWEPGVALDQIRNVTTGVRVKNWP